jgi:hypothetical protein
MTCASHAWEVVAGALLLKLQHFAKQGSPHHCQFSKAHTPARELHKAFGIPYIYDYLTKSCRQQAEVIQNHENANVRNIGQGEAQHRKCKRLKVGDGQAYDRSSV